MLYGKGEPENVLMTMKLSYSEYLIRYFLPPASMLVAAYGLWQRKIWGWWLCALIVATTVVTFLLIFMELPFKDFIAYIFRQRVGFTANIVVLAYLFLPSVFKKFNGPQADLVTAMIIIFLLSTITGDFVATERLKAF